MAEVRVTKANVKSEGLSAREHPKKKNRRQRAKKRANEQRQFQVELRRLTQRHTVEAIKVVLGEDNDLHKQVKAGSEVGIKYWLSQPAAVKLCSQLNEQGLAPIGLALELNLPLNIIKLFFDRQAFYITCNQYDETILHLAIVKKRQDVIDALLNSVEDIKGLVNLRNSFGETAFHSLIQQGDIATIEKMLAIGADCSLPDNMGKSPIDIAITARTKHVGAVVKMLLEKAIKNFPLHQPCQADGCVYLHMVAAKDDAETIRVLAAYGAKLAVVNFSGETALHLAARNNACKAAGELLNQAKINSESLLKMKDSNGNTALHIAFLYGHVEMVDLLLKRSSDLDDINRLNADKKTPYDLLCFYQDRLNDDATSIVSELSHDIKFFSPSLQILDIPSKTRGEALVSITRQLRPNTVSMPSNVQKHTLPGFIKHAIEEHKDQVDRSVLELMQGEVVFYQRYHFLLEELQEDDNNVEAADEFNVTQAKEDCARYAMLYQRYVHVYQAIYANDYSLYHEISEEVLKVDEEAANKGIAAMYLKIREFDSLVNSLKNQQRLLSQKEIQEGFGEFKKVSTLKEVDMQTMLRIFLTADKAILAKVATPEVRNLMVAEIKSQLAHAEAEKRYAVSLSAFLEQISKRAANARVLSQKVKELGKYANGEFEKLKSKVYKELKWKGEDVINLPMGINSISQIKK